MRIPGEGVIASGKLAGVKLGDFGAQEIMDRDVCHVSRSRRKIKRSACGERIRLETLDQKRRTGCHEAEQDRIPATEIDGERVRIRGEG